ncbi:MAG TPA: MBL fold metallo-hydrolase [Dehalococcoidales bacterium]|nr:MBL fold metallo-hydrolase [Dehalococcoidales bacterium]
MKIKWLAHASFLITSDSGTRILTDPYHADGDKLAHAEFKESADIVTVSHGHGDHNNVKAAAGNPLVLNTAGAVSGVKDKTIKIKTVQAAHDDAGGSKRGQNIIFCFEIDGVNICHLGDLGHPLTDEQAKAIGKVDVLMIPVGGFFTVEPPIASQVIDQLKPKVILPMHYKTDKISIPIKPPDEFLKGRNNVKRPDTSEIEIKAGKLPAKPEIIMLKYAL